MNQAAISPSDGSEGKDTGGDPGSMDGEGDDTRLLFGYGCHLTKGEAFTTTCISRHILMLPQLKEDVAKGFEDFIKH